MHTIYGRQVSAVPVITTRCQFSLGHYFDALAEAKRLGYRIGRVCDLKSLRRHKRFIMLRHDVDFWLADAYKLAVQEHKRGIRSTYLILPQNPYHNPLSNEGVAMMREMTKMGHEIGLHYDSAVARSSRDLASYIDGMATALGTLVGQRITTMAQHRPASTRGVNAKNSTRYTDVQGRMIQGAAEYRSDSGMNWRQGCMCGHVGKIDRIHLCTHTEWWAQKPMTRSGALRRLDEAQKTHYKKEFSGLAAETRKYIAALKRGDIS